MTKCITASSIDDLLRAALKHLKRSGRPLATSRGPCTELTDVHLVLSNPVNRVSWTASRLLLYSPLAELAWYLSGADSAEQIAYYLPRYQPLAADGHIPGGYGPRLFGDPPHEQLNSALELLRNRPATRRAAVQIFEAGDREVSPKNVPCTCTLQFLLREGALSLIVYMRSNDIWLGFIHDAFCFTMLQEMFARDLGVELGTYTHLVGSLHLYDEHSAGAQQYLAEKWQSPQCIMPPMPAGSFAEARGILVDSEQRIRAGSADPEWHSSPYWRDIQRLLCLFVAQKENDNARHEDLRSSLENEAYRMLVPSMSLEEGLK